MVVGALLVVHLLDKLVLSKGGEDRKQQMAVLAACWVIILGTVPDDWQAQCRIHLLPVLRDETDDYRHDS